MAIISQETWDKFTEEEKLKIKEKYRYEFMEGSQLDAILLEDIFGKENLQPKPKIRTWKDVQESEKLLSINYDRRHTHLTVDNNIVSTKVINKIIATYKIAHLINKGYGGIVTEEEWKDDETIKFGVKWSYQAKDWVYHNYETTKHFISFHTREQREEFMSYPENVELIRQYYLL